MPINRIEDGVPPTKNSYIEVLIGRSNTVAPANIDDMEIKPPAGKLWQITNMYLLSAAPPGASGGSHTFTFRPGNPAGNLAALQGGSVFNQNIEWNYSHWDNADHVKKPNTDIAAQRALMNILITADKPLIIRYVNATDAAQTNVRQLELSILETSLI